jgi:5'-3' exonuclease
MGVPCVQSEGEGEACCAALGACGLVSAIHTKDSDVLSFGASLNRHLINSHPGRNSARSSAASRAYYQNMKSPLVYRELHMDGSSKLCRAQVFIRICC